MAHYTFYARKTMHLSFYWNNKNVVFRCILEINHHTKVQQSFLQGFY